MRVFICQTAEGFASVTVEGSDGELPEAVADAYLRAIKKLMPKKEEESK